MPLKLSAEPFASTGGIAGEGARKLLGAPTLGPLQIVVREAGQNSWDARRNGQQVRFGIRLRQPTAAQWQVFRDEIFSELPRSPNSRARLKEALDADRPMLLEISDFGTKGLGGPTRADLSAGPGENMNFVNFIRNIGSGQHRPMGGGTYGFGKTSFYDLDPCATIIVDSLAQVGSSTERRLIACHLGDEFDSADGHRFTGRHWWGEAGAEQGLVEPVTGDAAVRLARRAGFPLRDGEDGTGTTVCVLVPELSEAREAAGVIMEALLWFLWPKMVAAEGQAPPMSFSLHLDSEQLVIPAPESVPPLDLFVGAWRQLKARGDGIREIRCGNPKALLGRMSIVRGFRGDRRVFAPEPIIPKISSHVALMRPVELVVKYLRGPALPNGSHEWAGVFICNSEEEVERAFASSEPAAHDDWSPDNLPKGRQRTFVKVGLQRIVEAMHSFVSPPVSGAAGPSDQPPLAGAAAILGRLIPLAPKESRPRPGSGQRGRRRPWSVSEPRFLALEAAGTVVEALFRVEARNASREPLTITALPGVFADDEIDPDANLPEGGQVEVVGWETLAGEELASGSSYELAAGEAVELRVRVRVPEPAAVGVLLEVSD